MSYAHTPNSNGDWHYLNDHLWGTAERSNDPRLPFGAQNLSVINGITHDIGKHPKPFQDYLEAMAKGLPWPKTPHSPLSAALAYKIFSGQDFWREVVLPVAGHHAGLQEPGIVSARITNYLHDPILGELQKALMPLLSHFDVFLSWKPKEISPLKREFLIRMLFSRLVDSDRLDTEAHSTPEAAKFRMGYKTVDDLWSLFQKDQEEVLKKSRINFTPVNEMRCAVYESSIRSATGPQGFYRMTAPTGGAKTRAGLAFALQHAVSHGLRRVIIAVPYTSIIDQNAQIYKEILGEESVLEHHSQVPTPENDTEEMDGIRERIRLSTENWDAPVIVTTTVQLFESLFSAKPGRARKLHNIMESVIVVDEAQTLPPELLLSTADVMRSLVEDYRVTIVLCTATQPSLQNKSYLAPFEGAEWREVIPDFKKYFLNKDLRRVEFEVRRHPVTVKELANELSTIPQAMVILNSRRDARRVFKAVKKNSSALYLSRDLCMSHRRRVLDRVEKMQADKAPIILVTTQVVEAGVSLDFPVVFRAIGPLDRIIQAAGRCNREGRCSKGRMIVFCLEGDHTPKGPYLVGKEKTLLLFNMFDQQSLSEKLHHPEIFEEYFSRLYSDIDLDKFKIQALRSEMNYPAVEKAYRFIPEASYPVVVPFGKGMSRLQEWLKSPSILNWQKLQPFIVSLYEKEMREYLEEEKIKEVHEGLFVWEADYDFQMGGGTIKKGGE